MNPNLDQRETSFISRQNRNLGRNPSNTVFSTPYLGTAHFENNSYPNTQPSKQSPIYSNSHYEHNRNFSYPSFGSSPSYNNMNSNYNPSYPYHRTSSFQQTENNFTSPSSRYSYFNNRGSHNYSPNNRSVLSSLWGGVQSLFPNFFNSYNRPSYNYDYANPTNYPYENSSPMHQTHASPFSQSPFSNRSSPSSSSPFSPRERTSSPHSPISSQISSNPRRIGQWENNKIEEIQQMNRYHNDWVLFNSLIFLTLAFICFVITHSPLRFIFKYILSNILIFMDIGDDSAILFGNSISVLFLFFGIIACYKYLTSPVIRLNNNYQRALVGLPPSTSLAELSPKEKRKLPQLSEVSPSKISPSHRLSPDVHSLPKAQDVIPPTSFIPRIKKISDHQTLSPQQSHLPPLTESEISFNGPITEVQEEVISPQSLKYILDKQEKEKDISVPSPYPSYYTEDQQYSWTDSNSTFKYQPSIIHPRVPTQTGHGHKVPFEDVLTKLKLFEADLNNKVLNLKRWFNHEIIRPLVNEINKYEKNGIDIMASIPVSWSDKVGNQNSLPLIQKSLRVYGCTSTKYLIQRLRDLSKHEFLIDFVWDGGGLWAGTPELSTDSQILIHLFCVFMEEKIITDKQFYFKYFAQTPQIVDPTATDITIYQTDIKPPHFELVLSNEIWEIKRGRYNLFYTLIIFIYYVKHFKNGFLGNSSLNQLFKLVD